MTLFQTPFVIDISQRKDDIAPVNEFEPAFQGYIQALFIVAALAAFFYMLWGALDWIMSQGESGKIEAARKKITHSIIGLVLLASIGAIFLVLQSFLGISILTNSGATSTVPLGQPGEPCAVSTTCASGLCIASRCQ